MLGINSVRIHPERITRKDKKLVNNLSYDSIEFPTDKEDATKTETKSNIWINVFGYENRLPFPIYI